MSIHVCVRERGEEIVAAFAEKAPRVGERVVYYTSKKRSPSSSTAVVIRYDGSM